MTNTTFKQFEQEQMVLESVENSGLMEELLQQDEGEWSDEMTADQLIEALGIGSDIQN